MSKIQSWKININCIMYAVNLPICYVVGRMLVDLPLVRFETLCSILIKKLKVCFPAYFHGLHFLQNVHSV